MNKLTCDKIFDTLVQYGTTVSTDHVPALFKSGAGLDSESTTLTEQRISHYTKDKKPVYKTYVKDCFCYGWQLSIDPSTGYIYRTPREIINALTSIVDVVKSYNDIYDTDAKYIIWVANFAHEYAFLKKYLHDSFEVTKIFAKNIRDILYIQLNGCVEIRESIGLFGHSLDDIAKHWCKSDNQKLKGDLDYNLIRTSKTPLKDEIPYMIHDVTILSEMHRNVINHYTQQNGVCVLPYTSSGFVRLKLKEYIRNDLALTEQRKQAKFLGRVKKCDDNIKYLKHKNWNLFTDPFQWFICREYGYSGGLCGSNIDIAGTILENVVCADLTSDYPAQLSHKKYPSGKLHRAYGDLDQKRKELDKNKKPYIAVLYITELQAKTQHATISKHKIINDNPNLYKSFDRPKNVIAYNGKLHKAESIILCMNDVDLNAYKELYTIKGYTLSLWYFDSYAPAPEWLLNAMWDDYEEKALLKLQGLSGTQEYMDCKKRINSYYGVLAQRLELEVLDAVDSQYNPCTAKNKTFKDLRKRFWLNPYIAFWCTSYARSILMHFLARFPDSIVQYDTDSLYFLESDTELKRALMKYNGRIKQRNYFLFHNRENAQLFEDLGTWEFEETYEKFLGMGAKKYMKQDSKGIHTVIAGLPKNAIPREIEEKGITEPFDYYNPLVKYLQELDNDIIIRHMFAGKFASVYEDDPTPHTIQVTDYLGNTYNQTTSSYHAILPIDFTLSIAPDYIKHILKRRE